VNDDALHLLKGFQRQHTAALAALGEEEFERAVSASVAHLHALQGTQEPTRALSTLLAPRYGIHARAIGVIALAKWLEQSGG
jgi:hypothetical protein